MKWIVPAMLVLVALIHLPPLLGMFGVAKMESAYGVGIAGPDLAVLMRHRALMFGLLGGFILLAWATPGHNANLSRVAMVDVFAVLFALTGLVAWWLQRGATPPP